MRRDLDVKELSDQQKDALRTIVQWRREEAFNDRVFVLHGFAGTGKTELTRYVAAELGLQDLPLDVLNEDKEWMPEGRYVAYGTYTGKAARVMRDRGIPARTLHSLCYKPLPRDDDAIDELKWELDHLDGGIMNPRHALLTERLLELVRPKFVVNDKSLLRLAGLLVVDEASMIPGWMIRDLLTFDVPVLAVGDPFQLQPIDDDGKDAFEEEFRRSPDYFLNEPSRWAKDNPIIAVATMVREGKRLPFGTYGSTVIKKQIKPRSLYDFGEYYLAADQVLAGVHETRRPLNVAIRELQGLREQLPTGPTDKIIVTRNKRTFGLLNGDFVKLENVSRARDIREMRADVTPLDGDGVVRRECPVYAGLFLEHFHEHKDKLRDVHDRHLQDRMVELDYGNVLTVHKAQGSEWEKVVVIDQSGSWANRNVDRPKENLNWLYTAITRARRVLMILAR